MSKAATLKDVATAAEVDPSTASFVINGKGDKLRIKRDTQARILAAARQLGYHSPLRGISDGKSQIGNTTPENRQIGLVLASTSPVETLALIPGLEPTLSAAGYQLVVITLPADPAAAGERVLKHGLAGLICCRTVYSAVSALVSGACPTIVLWEGAGKAILNSVRSPQAEATVAHSEQSAVSSPQPPAQPATIVTPKPITVPPIAAPKPIAVATPKPEIVEPTSTPSPAPVLAPVTAPRPVSVVITPAPLELTPITVVDSAADTAATTEEHTAPVAAEEERAAPVVTGVSPVESSDQVYSEERITPVVAEPPPTTPEPAPSQETGPGPVIAPAPVPVLEPSSAIADPEPEASPLTPELPTIPVTEPPTPAAVPEPDPTPIPTLVPEPVIEPTIEVPASEVEPAPVLPTPEPVAVTEPEPVPVAPTPEPVVNIQPVTPPIPEPVPHAEPQPVTTAPPPVAPEPTPEEIAPPPASPEPEIPPTEPLATPPDSNSNSDPSSPEAESQTTPAVDTREL